MGIKHLREENGSGLVLTLMVLLVLSVLGISIGTLTIGSYRLGDANRDGTSAYYVAEAGAFAAYEEIQSQVLQVYKKNATEGAFYDHISTIVSGQAGPSSVDFEPQFGSKPTATITTARQDEKTYIITSTGEVDGKKRTVTKEFTVNWIEKNTGGGGSGLPALPANAALLTEGDATVVGNTLIGDIYAGGDFNKPNGNVTGNIYTNGNVSISYGTLTGDIYTNSTKKGGFHVDSGIDLKSTTVFHSNKIQAKDLLKYPDWNVNRPKMVAKENVWDGNAYIQSFQGYRDLLNNITVPTNTVTQFQKLPDETIKKDDSNSYKVLDNGNLYLNSWMLDKYNLEIKDNIAFNKIIVESGKILTIDTMGGNHTIAVENLSVRSGTLNIVGGGTITFVVNNLQVSSSNLNIVGDSTVSFLVEDLQLASSNFNISKDGTVKLVVDGKMTFGHNLYINKTGTSNQLLFMYTGPTPDFKNITQMNAHVIVLENKGPVNVDDSNINGIFVTDNNKVNYTTGNNKEGASKMMLIAPEASVSLSGSYSIKGAVIAEKFTMSDGARLEYAAIDTSGFPFGDSAAPAVDPELGDLIGSGVIIEN